MPTAANRPSPDELWDMDRRHTLYPWTNFGPFAQKGARVTTRGEGWLG